MLIKLVAFQLDLFYAWKDAFKGVDDVEVIDGDVLAEKADALVSPANSFGYMDGGLDLKISQTLGWDVEKKVRARILEECNGELPVGNALIVETGLDSFPYLISAPTMRVPMDVSETVNAYLAFKAILDCVNRFNAEEPRIASIACPGLGTGEGKMPAGRCALQMREAYEAAIKGRVLVDGGLAAAVRQHMHLLDK